MKKTVLITGITGYISQYLLRHAPDTVRLMGSTRREQAALKNKLWKIIRLNLTKDVAAQLDAAEVFPDVVLHTAALSGLGDCQRNPQLAERVNAQATAELARWCQKHGVRLVYLSTDIVFKGDRPPYDEQEQPDPINVYGRSKWHGEQAILKTGGDFAIGRIALALGRGLNGTHNFIDWFVQRLQSGQPVTLFTDEIRTATYVGALAERFWQLALSAEQGIFHVCGAQALDRFTLGRALCDYLGYGHDLLKPISLNDMNDYPRPADVSLLSTRTVDGQPFTIPSIMEYIPLLFGNES